VRNASGVLRRAGKGEGGYTQEYSKRRHPFHTHFTPPSVDSAKLDIDWAGPPNSVSSREPF